MKSFLIVVIISCFKNFLKNKYRFREEFYREVAKRSVFPVGYTECNYSMI